MTISIQSECFISAQLGSATPKFGYNTWLYVEWYHFKPKCLGKLFEYFLQNVKNFFLQIKKRVRDLRNTFFFSEGSRRYELPSFLEMCKMFERLSRQDKNDK